MSNVMKHLTAYLKAVDQLQNDALSLSTCTLPKVKKFLDNLEVSNENLIKATNENLPEILKALTEK
jgi:hypothetical protein